MATSGELQVELELTLRGTLTTYHPAVMYLKNGDPGYPAEGGELEDFDIILEVPHWNKVTQKTEYTEISMLDKLPKEVIEAYQEKLMQELTEKESDDGYVDQET